MKPETRQRSTTRGRAGANGAAGKWLRSPLRKQSKQWPRWSVLTEGWLRRSATGVDADRVCVRAGAGGGRGMLLLKQGRQLGGCCGERVCGRPGAGSKARKKRAGGGCGDEGSRSGTGFGHHCGHAHCHGTVMRAVTPAAGRQAGVLAARECRSEGPQPENHDQKEGKRTTHLLHVTRGWTRLAGRCAELHRHRAPGRLSSETIGSFKGSSFKVSIST